MAVENFNIKDLNVTSTLSISGSPVINSNGSNQVIVNSGATGDIGLLLTSNTKAVSLEVATNQQLTVKGGADSFIFDVSSGTGGITFPDGTTQNTAAGGGGIAPGTTTGNMLYWDGAAWVEADNGLGRSLTFDFSGPFGETNLTLAASNNIPAHFDFSTDGSGYGRIQWVDTSSSNVNNRIESSHDLNDGIMLFHNETPASSRFIVGDGTCIGIGWQGGSNPSSGSHIKNWNTAGQNVLGAINLNSHNYGSTMANTNNTCIATTVSITDAAYKNAGAAGAFPTNATGQRGDYVCHFAYKNLTTNETERVTFVVFAPDGINIFTTEYAFMSSHAGARQLRPEARYFSGQLQIGFWMDNVTPGDAGNAQWTIIATG